MTKLQTFGRLSVDTVATLWDQLLQIVDVSQCQVRQFGDACAHMHQCSRRSAGNWTLT